MITPENIASHELIGLRTEIVESSNRQIVGLNGTIIYETKHMFTLDTSKGRKSIPKSINSWKFVINNQERTLRGDKITKRPYDRMGVKA